jgi:hypothetical protein
MAVQKSGMSPMKPLSNILFSYKMEGFWDMVADADGTTKCPLRF